MSGTIRKVDRQSVDGSYQTSQAPADRVRGAIAEPDLREPPGHLGDEMRVRWADIVRRRLRVEGQNYFEMLGVKRNADVGMIRAAFVALSKRVHPERLPADLAPLKDHATDLFRHLNEAHDVLRDNHKRGEYHREVDAGGGTPRTRKVVKNVIEADTHFHKAQILAKRRDVETALSEVQSAIEKDDSHAEYHALRGWLIDRCATEGKGVDPKVWACLDRALKIDRRCEMAHYYKGALLKRVGRDKDALVHFKLAVAVNPDNIEAQREVRLAAMRRNKRRKSSGLVERVVSGFLKRDTD